MENAILSALSNLEEKNEMIFMHWLSELYDENDCKIESAWNEENLELMERDAMQQSLL